MTDNPAPVQLTGGSGFDFEDHVAAYIMAHLLNGRLLLDDLFGKLISLDFQVRESGWYLDDLLLTGQKGAIDHQASISVKRGKQVTSNGFPPDFVESVWKQWLSTDNNPLNKQEDLLCMATGQLSGKVLAAWNDLLNQALKTAPERLLERLSSNGQCSKIQKSLFNSLLCPPHMPLDDNSKPIETVKLLRNIRLLYYDFRSVPSREQAYAMDLCQSILCSGSADEATCLWSDLVSTATDLRIHGGSIDLPGLIHRLKNYTFSDFPDYVSDWLILDRLKNEALQGIRCEIGPGIKLPRNEITAQIQQGLENSRIAALLGESGTGKSALAKNIAEQRDFDRIVWIDEDFFLGRISNASDRGMDLTHEIKMLLSSAGDRKPLLVLDGIEKYGLSHKAKTLQILEALEFQNPSSRWHLIITSQPLNWPAIRLELGLSNGFSQEVIHSIPYPSLNELAPVTERLPQIAPLLIRPDLLVFLHNLKILDLISKAAENEIPDANRFAGLSDLIDWIWNGWIQNGPQRFALGGLLRKIGVKEADGFSSGVTMEELDSPELELLVHLVERLLVKEKNGRITFTHDLLGDWSRLQILSSAISAQLTNEIRSKAENPRWHNAIRHLGLRLLEHNTRGQNWQDLYEQLDDNSKAGRIATDLLLEGIIFAPNARTLLELLWPTLQADNGRLLRRLLTNFKQRATVPDPTISTLMGQKGSNIWVSSTIRTPLWLYWGPMLSFLHAHKDEVKKLAIKSAAELCQTWLATTPPKSESGESFLWRRETAELAIRIAREVQALKAEKIHFSDEADRAAYEAFLYAAHEFPDEVSELGLELAKRNPEAPEIRERAEAAIIKEEEIYKKRCHEDREYAERLMATHSIESFMGRLSPPWPNGPTEMVGTAFRKACMNGNALRSLIMARPDTAREMILALCISHPTREYNQSSFGLRRYGTVSDADEPMFFRGPFFLFLKLNPAAAIDVIVELVNFATLRWRDRAQNQNGIKFGNELNEDGTVDLWVSGSNHKWLGAYSDPFRPPNPE